MTDTEKDALCARIDELCAELSKAQLSLDMWHDRAEDMRNRLLVKQAENAELRELVKHINTCNIYTSIECANVHCWECPYDNSTGNCDFDKRMRELGIEVDG